VGAGSKGDRRRRRRPTTAAPRRRLWLEGGSASEATAAVPRGMRGGGRCIIEETVSALGKTAADAVAVWVQG